MRRITNGHGLYRVPVLAGSGVTREPGTLLVSLGDDGSMCDEDGRRISVTDGGDLMGWGGLDGQSYCLQPEGCAWYVNAEEAREFIAAHDRQRNEARHASMPTA